MDKGIEKEDPDTTRIGFAPIKRLITRRAGRSLKIDNRHLAKAIHRSVRGSEEQQHNSSRKFNKDNTVGHKSCLELDDPVR